MPSPISTPAPIPEKPSWKKLAEWQAVCLTNAPVIVPTDMPAEFTAAAAQHEVPSFFASRVLRAVELSLFTLKARSSIDREGFTVIIRLFLQENRKTLPAIKGWGYFLIEHTGITEPVSPPIQALLIDAYLFQEGE